MTKLLTTDMRYPAGSLLLVIFLGCFCPALHAQKNAGNLITATFHDAPIQEIVEEVERQTDYFFYYDASLFDSLLFTFSVTKEPLSSVMDRAFANTNLNYAIGPHDEVFLTREVPIQTNLTATLDSLKGKHHAYHVEIEEDQNLNNAYQCHLVTSKSFWSQQSIDQVNKQESRDDSGDGVFH